LLFDFIHISTPISSDVLLRFRSTNQNNNTTFDSSSWTTSFVWPAAPPRRNPLVRTIFFAQVARLSLGKWERVFGRRWLRSLLLPHHTEPEFLPMPIPGHSGLRRKFAGTDDPVLHKLVVFDGGGEQEVVVLSELNSLA
jgi:hypothetical protein